MSATITANRLEADVLVVGAGPTGLALATMLRRSGIATVIVDKLPTGLNTSRAAVIHAHTLEVLEQLGVTERLVLAEGLAEAGGTVRRGWTVEQLVETPEDDRLHGAHRH